MSPYSGDVTSAEADNRVFHENRVIQPMLYVGRKGRGKSSPRRRERIHKDPKD